MNVKVFYIYITFGLNNTNKQIIHWDTISYMLDSEPHLLFKDYTTAKLRLGSRSK